jgi:hypothetical protein
MWEKTAVAAYGRGYRQINDKGALMYHDTYGTGNWFWMVPMMLALILVLGGVVYAAVRLGVQHSHSQLPPVDGQ